MQTWGEVSQHKSTSQKLFIRINLPRNRLQEQYADAILFLLRPEYYEIPDDLPEDFNGVETHIRIAKNRHGVLDTIKLKAALTTQQFKDWDYDYKLQG